MSVRPILRYPHPLLKQPARPVDRFDDGLARLAADLLDTMRAAPGVGIAGPHVGVMERVLVIQLSPADPVWTCINPSVVWSGAETARHAEGSIAMPGISEEVERPTQVRVAYRDLDGTDREIAAEGWLAVCLQHEIDQLDGIFWLQRLSRLKRDRAIKRFGKSTG